LKYRGGGLRIQAAACAKLNISLDVHSKLPDGYHEMRMVMQTVTLCDDVAVTCAPGEGVSVGTTLHNLPGDDRNIAAKAAASFFEYTGITDYAERIDIRKRIPVCAGLGGGSSDGAAVLRALNELFKTDLSGETLEKIGESVGSDVPFCVRGGTVLAAGRGNVLSDLPAFPACELVIVKPSFALSTPALFAKLDCNKIKRRPDTDGIINALRDGSLRGVARRMYNVFEDILPRGRDELETVKSRLLDFNALGAVMTGTGSAVFGVFDDLASARAAHAALKQSCAECFLAKPVGRLTAP
jgi:4-diphosphocytidyl-2-C-methyl-D-erythritol kinase